MDKFYSKPGESNAMMPQCKECGRCIIEDGLKCTIFKQIPMNIRLNEEKCDEFIEKE